MKLSVLIVNHNLCALLRKSIDSLINAAKNVEYEIIVVDNASTDKSVDMVTGEFPEVLVIHNESNNGFTKAANQGMRMAKGEYVFVVSADTLTNKDTLDKVLDFMDMHPKTGGVSIRMITPMGDFIKSSKYSISRNWLAFFKLIGLYRFLPKSNLFTRRHADWVEEFETAEIDVLNNSCMLLRRSVLNKVGLLDERFVNYGQNIDFSYRIRLAGFKNFYYAHTYMINFTIRAKNKLTWNYMSQHYGAMFIFAAKYLLKLPVISLKNMGEMIPSSYEVER